MRRRCLVVSSAVIPVVAALLWTPVPVHGQAQTPDAAREAAREAARPLASMSI